MIAGTGVEEIVAVRTFRPRLPPKHGPNSWWCEFAVSHTIKQCLCRFSTCYRSAWGTGDAVSSFARRAPRTSEVLRAKGPGSRRVLRQPLEQKQQPLQYY